MTIGIDISALTVERTGVGNYSLSVLEHLLKLDTKYKYKLFAFVLTGKDTITRSQLARRKDVELKIYRTHRGLMRRFLRVIPLISADFLYRDIDFLHLSDIFHLPTRSIPIVATVYDMTPSLFPSFHYRRNIDFHRERNAFIAKQARLVITLSENSKKDINRVLKIPLDRIRVIPGAAGRQYYPRNGMDSVRNLLDKYRLQQGAYGLFVGTLEPRKNVETILEAFARIQSQLDPTFKIVLVGKRAWGWESIRATLRRLKLTRKVVVTGYVPAKVLPLLYSGAKVFLYPSYYEGFGLPVLEAMACGIPVITSNTSSLPEIVGNSGIMLEPKNSEELAKQMLRLIQDEEYHSEWARKGLARAQWFSWETAASKTLAAYREMEELL